MTQTELDAIVAEERRKYFREWRKNNKDKVKEHNATYWRKRVLKKLQTEGGEDHAANENH